MPLPLERLPPSPSPRPFASHGTLWARFPQCCKGCRAPTQLLCQKDLRADSNLTEHLPWSLVLKNRWVQTPAAHPCPLVVSANIYDEKTRQIGAGAVSPTSGGGGTFCPLERTEGPSLLSDKLVLSLTSVPSPAEPGQCHPSASSASS